MRGHGGPAVAGRRLLAVFLAVYLAGSTVLAAMPAALADEPATPPSEEAADPHSLADLVEWLEEHGLTAATAPASPVGPEHALTQTALDPIVAQAIADWETAAPDADLSGVTVTVADLPDLQLGTASGTSVEIDVDGAGHGWSATFPAEEAAEHLDLLTAVRHELGHVLGHDHTDGLMGPTLAVGEVHAVPTIEASTSDTTTDATADDTTMEDDGSTTDTTTSDTSDTSTTETSTSDTSTTEASTSDTSSSDSSSSDAPATDTSTGTVIGDEPASGWTVDGTTATFTTDGALDHVLQYDEAAGEVGLADIAGVVDGLALDGIDQLVVMGSAGDDHLTLDLVGALPVSVSYDAGTGTDTLVGPATDQQWMLDGPDAGSVAGVSFSSVENVTGGIDNEDEFVVTPTGSVTGIVAGGDGGYDTIVVDQSGFATVHYTVTGADSGTIVRDGDLLTYVGMEPVTGTATSPVTSGTTLTVTGDGTAETITIEDDGDAANGFVYVRFSSGEDHYIDLNGASSLRIEGAAGDDAIVLASRDDALLGVTLEVAGDAGTDTFTIDDAAGTWELTGIGTGTWTDATADLAFAFEGFENLVGATNAAETYDLQPGGTVTGSIDDTDGTLTVKLGGFGSITGNFDFGTTTYSGTDTNGGAVGDVTPIDVLTVTGTDGAIFFGLEAAGAQLGVSGTAGNWGIAVLTDGTNVWQAWQGSFTNPTLTGLGELDLDVSSFDIEVNTAAASGHAIDFAAGILDLTTVVLDLGSASTAVSAIDARIELADFVWIEGDLSLELGEDQVVTVDTSNLTDTTAVENAVSAAAAEQDVDPGEEVQFDSGTGTLTNVPVSTVSVGLTGADLFVGRNTVGFSLFDAATTDWEGLGADGIAVLGLDIGFALAQVSPEQLQGLLGDFLAVRANVATIDLVGLVAALELQILNGELSYNRSNEVAGQTGSSAWVDWAASFPGTPDGFELTVPGGSGSVLFDMDAPVLEVGADDALLSFDGFVTVAGGFSYQAGALADVEVTTSGTRSDGTSTVEVATTLIGFTGASVFVGDPGDFTATATGFACTAVDASTAVGVCASGIDLGVILAAPTDTNSVLPDFLAVQGEVATATIVGLPSGFTFDLQTITFGVNQGGEVLDAPGSSTTITGSNAWVDWSAYDGGSGFDVPTSPSSTFTVDLDGPIVGVAAEKVLLDIGGFVTIAGSFAFEQGTIRTVEIGIDGLGADEGTFAADAGADYDAGVLSNVDVTTTTIGIGNASLFAGYSPEGIELTDTFECASFADSYGLCVEGIDVGIVMATLLDPDAVSGWTLPDFLAARVDIANPELLGLPTDVFTLDFEGLHLAFNRAGELKHGTTPVADSRAWIRWGASFPDPDGAGSESGGLAVPTGSGNQYIDLDDPKLVVAADDVLLTVGAFVSIRGSFQFEQGGQETVSVGVAGLGTADESALTTAATDAGLTFDGDTLRGVEVTTTSIGIGDAEVFAGYAPGGFDTTTPIDCETMADAYGFCVDGVDVGIVLASLTDPTVLGQYGLPGFTGVKVDITDFELLGLPADIFDLDFTNLSISLNTGGAVRKGPGTAKTPIPQSLAWIDWVDSFPAGPSDTPPAGFVVTTPSGDQYIDMADPILGIAAERVSLRISDFVSVAGSFAFEKGALVDLAVDTPTLTSTQRSSLQASISSSSLSGDQVLVEDVATSTFGIGGADVYVGYADGGFDTAGAPVGDFYGLQTTGIDLGMVWATIAPTRYTGAYRLPGFFGLTGDIASLTFAGIPPDILSFSVDTATVSFNSGGVITGLVGHEAHANWADTDDGDGPGNGVTVPTGTDTEVTVDHEDAIVGLSADLVVLTIGEFIHVSGGFAFEQGGNEELDVRVLGLNSGEYLGLQSAVTAATVGGATLSGTVAGGDVTINDLLVTTTLLGIDNATVFAGYNPSGFTPGDALSCTDPDLQADGIGFCLDGIQVGLAIADAVAGQTGTYTMPQFMAVRANLPGFDINTNLVGLDLSEFQLYFEGLAVTVNQGGDVGTTVGADAFVDWNASFGGSEGDGLEVPTNSSGNTVLLDFDSPVISVSADVVVLSISDFVHVSGSFAFTTGERVTVDVDIIPDGVGTPTRLNNVTVQTTTFGISDAAIFVGYNPNAGGTGGSSFDLGPDKVFTDADLSDDAVGLFLENIDFGLVFASEIGALATWNLPTFTTLRARVGNFQLKNLLPDVFNVVLQGIAVTYNGGGTATGAGTPGYATIDWSSAPGGGYDIPTGTTTDPVTVSMRGNVIGVEASLVIISISEFVHISGGFSLVKGQILDVDIETNAALQFAGLPILVSESDPGDTTGLPVRRTSDGRMLWNVDVQTIELGITNASIFVGYAPNISDGTFDITAGDDDKDDVLDQSDLGTDYEGNVAAFGLLIEDVDVGLVVADILPGQLTGYTGDLPTLTGLSLTGEQVALLGIPFITFEVNGLRVEVNIGDKWTTAPSAAVGPAIDWQESFTSDGGYEVSTGEGNDPVVLRMDGYLIGGGAELVVLGILDFIHVRGSFYFESGVTETVPITSGAIDTSFLPTEIEQFVMGGVGTPGEKELRFFNIGIADAYAFVGLNGPHWVLEDAGDPTSDLQYECDPDALGGCDEATDCPTDGDTADGIARALAEGKCRTVTVDEALGVAVSDLDMALAIGTPTFTADPTKYITLRASVEFAGLVGLEQYGLQLTAQLEDVSLELNIATPTLNGFPILPVIDWRDYADQTADDTGCTDEMLAGEDPLGDDCAPFGVKTGQRDPGTGELLTEDFLYEGLLVRAAVGLVRLDLFGVLAIRGSIAFNLGPVEDVTLTGGAEVDGVLTMTLGGANIFGFIGANGPFWVEDGDGNLLYTEDGTPGGVVCDPDETGCQLVRDDDAVGIAIEDLDFGLFVGAKITAPDPAVYFAANIELGAFGLVGVPGVTADAIVAIALNLGFTLGAGVQSPTGINFKDSFEFDEPDGEDFDDDTITGEDGVKGYLLDTGDPSDPQHFDFVSTFIQVQLAGSIEIRAGPDPTDDPIARIDGIFLLGIDLDAGAEEFRLLALGEMTIGPDVDTVTGGGDPLLSIGAIGVLILNPDGVAGDFTVNLQAGGPIAPILDLSVYARVIFNTTGQDMTLVVPPELSTYLTDLGTDAAEGVANPGALADDLLDRLEACAPPDDDLLCYTIDARVPDLISGDGPDVDTVAWLLGDGDKADASFGSAGAYVVAVLDGDLTVLGFASAEVFGAIAVSGSQFELIADFTFQLGPDPAVSLTVAASARAEISSAGFYIDTTVTIQANLLSVFDLDVSGSLTLDTRGASDYFELDLSGSVNVLRVVTLTGSVFIQVGGDIGANNWVVAASLGADIGPLGFSASGFISSWGSFSITGTAGIDLTVAGTGVDGSVTAHVSYCARSSLHSQTCLDNPTSSSFDPTTITPYTQTIGSGGTLGLDPAGRSFLVVVSGSAKLKALGITVAGVSAGVTIAGYLGDKVTVTVNFKVETFLGDIEADVDVASFYLPDILRNNDLPPPKLAELDPNDSSTLLLNVGTRRDERNVEKDETAEDYTITQDGGTITVTAFGWTETFTGIDHIIGHFGTDDDELVVYPEVTATLYATGGLGDDLLAHNGPGAATLHGNEGNDSLVGGSGADTLDGGIGNDYLDGGAGLDSLTGGPGTLGVDETDDDTFYGIGAQMAGETLAPGTGYDRLEVIGAAGPEAILLTRNGSDLQLSYDSFGALTLTGIDELRVRLQGGDDLTIRGAVDQVGLQVLSVAFTPLSLLDADDVAAGITADDTVTFELLATADDVHLSGAQALALSTFAQGNGVFAVSLTPTGMVSTTTVDWDGHLVTTLSGTDLAGDDLDRLIISTMGGDDTVAVTGIETDTTLQMGAGADAVAVGSGASCTAGTCTNSGTVNGINAPLDVDGGAGTDDVLDIDDTSDFDGDDTLTLTDTLVDGIGLHGDGIAYSAVETLDIHLGGGDDLVRALSTWSTTTTTIEGNDGIETFDVSSDAPTNDGSLNDIAGDLILDGGDGADTATFSDAGDTTGDTGTLTSTTLSSGFTGGGTLTYLSLVTLDIDLGSGGDNLTIESTHAGTTTVDAGAGADDIALQTTPSGSTLVIHGDAGDDDFEFGSLADASDSGTIATGGTVGQIDGAVTVNGDAPQASDTLHLDDTGNGLGGGGTLTRDTIVGFGMAAGVTYLEVEDLTIALGDGIDDLDVTSTNGPGDTDAVSETDATLLLGGGDDRVDVSSTGSPLSGDVNDILGHLTIDGEGGTDTVNVSDRADTAGNTGELTATDLTGLGMGTPGVVGHGITYAGLEYLNIDLGTGGDTFTVHSTHAGETTLDTRGGDDTVDVGGDDQTVDDVAGFLDIDTGAGDDDVTVNDQASTDEEVGAVTATTVEGLGATIDANNTASDVVHVVTITGGAYGDVTLSFGLGDATFALNASSAEVDAAITTALGAAIGDVTVSRTSVIRDGGTTFRITLTGALGGAVGRGSDYQFTVDTSALVRLDDTIPVTSRVVTMTTGRIEYTSVETLVVNLGEGVDHVALASTGAVTTINGGPGDDVVDVETIAHETTVNGRDGADTLQVNLFPQSPDTNDIDELLTLNGAADGDTFFIQLSGIDDSFITVNDSGASGVDNLTVQGSATDDQFLLRAELVALLNTLGPADTDNDGEIDDIGYLNAEYVSYGSGIENLIVNTLGGDDHVALDDTLVATTINLGDGSDFVQVGQLYGQECLDEPIVPGVSREGPGDTLDCFDPDFIPPFLIDTTQGNLSNGISESTTVNGGAGNDIMVVFRNRAVLALNGESGDDTFVIRTFLEEDSETQLDAGEGADVISYVMNAPVNVNGGDGYDRLYVIGTEADDVFVITANGVYGGGRYVTFVAIELLAVDTVEGNDRIHVQSTDPAVDVEVYGGLGSDTIDVGANLVPSYDDGAEGTVYEPVYAPSDDLIGHSGLIVHEIESGVWDALTIDGVATEVIDDDEPAVIIVETGGTTIVSEGDGSLGYAYDTYEVRLTTAPEFQVRIDALTAILTPEQENGDTGPEFNVELSTDGGTTWHRRGVSLLFDTSNWATPQEIWVRAVTDAAWEGERVTAIRHTVTEFITGTVGSASSTTLTDTGAFGDGAGGALDLEGRTLVVVVGGEEQQYVIDSNTADTLTIVGTFATVPGAGDTYEVRDVGAYEDVVLNDLGVRVLDDDLSEIVIVESGVDTLVGETGTPDSYRLIHTEGVEPVAPVDVTVTAPDGLCVYITDPTSCGAELVVTLAPGEDVWIEVRAIADGITEGFQYGRITHTTDAGPVGEVVVGIIDDHAPGVLVIESDGGTLVTEDGSITDSYTMELTAAPGGTVEISATAIPTKTQYDAGSVDAVNALPQCPSAIITGDRMTCEEIQVELRFRAADGSTGWSVWSATHTLVFTDANWDVGFEIEVRGLQDDVIDGRILQAFPEAPARVNEIQGGLYVDGGVSEFGYPLANFRPVLLPGEGSSDVHVTPNAAFDVIEDYAVDTLIVHNEDDVADSELDLTTTTAETSEISQELADLMGTDVTPSSDVDRFQLDGLGMGPRGIEYLGLEALDVLLGSGSDTVTVLTTHDGTTTLRGHAGDDIFDVTEILGHTRILGGDGGDTVTVTDAGQLESIDAQLLISGEAGDDTTIVDDSADTTDDTGTLTQTGLIGLDMDSVTPDNLFSLELLNDELVNDGTAIEITIVAYRAPDTSPDVDDPGVDISITFTIDAAAIQALADLGALPYGDYSAYAGKTLADLDAYLLAGLIQQALFPHVENADVDAYVPQADGSKLYTFPDGVTTGDDRFAETGCGREGTTDERDSRCANSVYVWDSGGRVYLVGFQGELAGLHITFSADTVDGTYATDLLRTDGITYDTLETLDIRLGDGNDLFNVRGTLPETILDTGDGDDVVFVSDAAGLYEHTRPGISGPEGLESVLADAADLEELHERTLHGTVVYDDHTYVGTLDEIDGNLDVDTGAGSNTLAVSDHASTDADTGFTISHDTITGLADGTITYDSSYDTTGGDLAGQGYWPRQGDAGMFGRGITIHLGTGADVGTIASVRGHTVDTPLQLTVTTVYGNDGHDTLTVDAPDVRDTDGTLLARLVVYGDDGDDTIDGTNAELPLIVFGEDGNDDIQGGTDDDVLFGDDGRVVLYRDTVEDTAGSVWDVWLGGTMEALPASVVPGTSTIGGAYPIGTPYPNDGVFETIDVIVTIFEDADADDANRDDVVRGGDGDDVVIGGVGDDGLDGEADRDLVVGDRVILTRNNDMTSPIVRALDGETLVEVDPLGSTTLGAVDGTHQTDPHGTWPWTITLLDHLSNLSPDGPTPAERYGDDVAAGGAGEDVVFGQLGDDLLHGDGVLNAAGDGFLDAALVDTSTDGDDYVEGNGGADTILGGLGQDDLLGGSSDLFGLVTREQRPDGIDTVLGGNGDAAARNDLGIGDGNLEVRADALSRDADVILGDNGRIYRLVGINRDATDAFLTFTHDLGCDPGVVECVIPRQVELLDYTPVGERFLLAVVDPAEPGAYQDVIGDPNIGAGDFLHGEASNDTIWGATGQDAIFGDAGHDDLYGGTNRDWISGGTGIDGIIADHGIILTSRHGEPEPLYGVAATSENANEVPELSTPGDLQTAHINQGGTLHKAVELDLVIDDVSAFTTFFVGDHDVVYGGLGDDFIHGGEGDDMLSGAEALSEYYTADPISTLKGIYGYFDSDAGILQHGVDREGEFRCYDEYNPLALVEVCKTDATPDGSGTPYLTNNDGTEDDGEDVIFGDGGNDWIVGGVNHDRVFGGWGDDLLDMDDDKSTNGGLNDAPDVATWVTYADIAYGGAGRDVLIANTGADRLIDWVGEYNSYIVPFSPYGAFTISRSLAPHLFQYLYDLSEAEGADVTRGGDTDRNGEPRGELGLVTQKDDAWQAQTGAPDDPQAGNMQGPRDVLREEDFSSASSATTAFAVESGSWSVVNGRYESVASLSSDAISIFYVDEVLPHQFEIVATVNSDKDRAGYRSNAYIIFDYQGPADFKFAGLEMGTDKVEIGWRTANGWEVLASYNLRTGHNTNYHLRLWVDGQVVTLYVDGAQLLSHDYGSPLLVPGEPSTALDPLTDGYVGIGSNGAISRSEYFAVQVLAPEITFSLTDEFAVAPSHATSGGTWSADGGRWTVAPASGEVALSLTSLTIAPSALLVLDTTGTTDGIAGVAFDVVSADRFKFAVLDTITGRLLFGHYASGEWVVEASIAVAVGAGTPHTLTVHLDGTTATAVVDGVVIGAHSWHSLLNDGDLGLLATGGTASFGHLALSTDDPALEPAEPFVNVADAEITEGDDGTTTLSVTVSLSRATDRDVTVSWSTADGTATGGSDYVEATGTVTILAGQLSATVVISITGDTTIEPDETFFLGLSSPDGGIIGDGTALLAIRNDDVDVVVDAAAVDASAAEAGSDAAVFELTRTGATEDTLDVRLSWQGTAGFAVDYTVTVTGGTLSHDGSVLTFDAGVSVVTLTATPVTDDLAEPTETIQLHVLADEAYGVGTATGSADLADDAALPTLSISDAEVLEGDRGGTWIELTVTLDAPSPSEVTVTYRTHEGTADTNDFRTETGTVTFAAGQTVQTIRVRVYADRTAEPNEAFTVELTNPANAVIADGVGVVAILDDEGGRLTAAGVSTGAPGVTVATDDVMALLPVAMAWWQAHGVDTTSLERVTVRVIDLPGRTLAMVSGDMILVDPTAAGFGWSLDGHAPGMDLLRVLVHELGHVLGHDHDGGAVLGGVMEPTLRTGDHLVTSVPAGPAVVADIPAPRSSVSTSEEVGRRVGRTGASSALVDLSTSRDERPAPDAPPVAAHNRSAMATTSGRGAPEQTGTDLLLLVVIAMLVPALRPTSTRHDRAHWAA